MLQLPLTIMPEAPRVSTKLKSRASRKLIDRKALSLPTTEPVPAPVISSTRLRKSKSSKPSQPKPTWKPAWEVRLPTAKVQKGKDPWIQVEWLSLEELGKEWYNLCTAMHGKDAPRIAEECMDQHVQVGFSMPKTQCLVLCRPTWFEGRHEQPLHPPLARLLGPVELGSMSGYIHRDGAI